MKSLFLFASLLLLASCGKEQFGTASKSESTSVSGLEKYSATFETKMTLLKPKVDIIYVIDNSSSTFHMQQALKDSVTATLGTISNQFDLRVISIPLISTSTLDYSVFTNSTDSLPSTSNIVPSANLLLNPIFSNIQDGEERGLARTLDFMNHHRSTGTSPSLLRPNAYHLIILVSNGHDQEVEKVWGSNGETQLHTVNGTSTTVFSQRLTSFSQLKTNLQSQQLRLFSVTASRKCTMKTNSSTYRSGWISSELSYQNMSKELYQLAEATDSSTRDVYDLCEDGLSKLFAGVNKSIKEEVVPHKYLYFPITFANDNPIVDTNTIQVKKISGNTITTLTGWTYEHYPNGVSKPMRTDPASEYVTSKHFIRLNSNQPLVYPDNILITSTSLVEYFQYVVIPRPAKNDGSIVVRINGNNIPATAISYEGYKANSNIKPSGSNTPDVLKSGYFIKITSSTYFYKSGDSVDVYYTPDSI